MVMDPELGLVNLVVVTSTLGPYRLKISRGPITLEVGCNC